MLVMKTSLSYISIPLVVTVSLYTNTLFAAPPAEVISLQADNFEHIQFKRIKPNNHTYENNVLKIEVDDSASFLMLAFNEVKKINKVNFDWRSEGLLLVKNIEHEAARRGDDAVIKIGLLLKSESSSYNPFAPSWLKRVDELMRYPSENMVYLVANAKHAAGEQWLNPYNDWVLMIAMGSATGTEKIGDWQQASHQFKQPQQVVAIWIMADGDNTDSKFTSFIKNITLE